MSFWEASSEPVVPDGSGRGARERAGLVLVLVVVVLLLLLVGGGYTAAYSKAGDRVPRGTEISGVRVGGLTRAAAVAKLETAFAARARQPMVLAAADETGAERSVMFRPDQIGLHIDAAASVDATGAHRSLRPGRLWDYFSDGAHRDAVVRIDRDRLTARIRTMSGGFRITPTDGRVVFTPTGARAVAGQSGDGISLDEAVQAVEQAYLADAHKAQVSVRPAQPDIDQSDVQQALDAFAVPAMSAPVVLGFGSQEVRLSPRVFASALSMTPVGGVLAPQIDRARVLSLVAGARDALAPRDATVRIVGRKPHLVPGRPGTSFSDDDVVTAFESALLATGAARIVAVPSRPAQPAVTTAAARAYGVRASIAAATTYVAAGTKPARVAALVRRVDQLVVPPRGTLALGRSAGVVAAATFTAAFRAGLTDLVTSGPITLGPRAARIVPVRFRNDSPYAVLVHVVAKPAEHGRPAAVRVALWSTKTYRVTIAVGPRRGRVAPPVHTGRGPRCHPSRGAAGYRRTITRTFRKVGKKAVDHTDSYQDVVPPVVRRTCR